MILEGCHENDPRFDSSKSRKVSPISKPLPRNPPEGSSERGRTPDARPNGIIYLDVNDASSPPIAEYERPKPARRFAGAIPAPAWDYHGADFVGMTSVQCETLSTRNTPNMENPVNDPLATLIRLQEIDDKLARQKEAQKTIPDRLFVSEQVLLRAREALLQTKTEIESLTKERKSLEIDLQVNEEKTGRLKSRLAELKTHKEYQTHMSEMETVKKEKGKIEEQTLLLMEKGEQLARQATEQEAVVLAEEKRFAAEKEMADEQLEQIAESVAALEQEWKVSAEGMDVLLLDEYRRLLSTQKNRAVVALRGQACGGCNVVLPPQRASEVRAAKNILRCSYCRRFLYATG